MSAYEEIMEALEFYFGYGEGLSQDEIAMSIYEIIGQEHDPIETIAKALEDYRENKLKVEL